MDFDSRFLTMFLVYFYRKGASKMQLKSNEFFVATVCCGNNRHARVFLSQISDPFGKPLIHVFFENEKGERIIRNVDAALAMFCRNFFSPYQYWTELDKADIDEIRKRFIDAISSLSHTVPKYSTLAVLH